MGANAIVFALNTGLTVGSAFSPTTRATIDSTGLSVSQGLSYNTASLTTYPIGNINNSGLRIIRGILDMNLAGVVDGEGFTTSGPINQGKCTIVFTQPFSAAPAITLTPIYRVNTAPLLGVTAVIDSQIYDGTSARVQTINTGTGASVWFDSAGRNIYCSFIAIGS